jgi:hypothetical protein
MRASTSAYWQLGSDSRTDDGGSICERATETGRQDQRAALLLAQNGRSDGLSSTARGHIHGGSSAIRGDGSVALRAFGKLQFIDWATSNTERPMVTYHTPFTFVLWPSEEPTSVNWPVLSLR